MNHAEIQAEVARLTKLIEQLERENYDEDVVDEAQDRLAELKNASARVLERDEGSLAGLIARNVEVWRDFKAKHRQILTFLDSLQ